MQPTGYLDTASIGLVPAAVGAAVGACYEAMGRGTRGSREWRPVVERAHQAYAAEFGVAEGEVAFMPSTADAIEAIAHAVPWCEGDEVLVLRDEFPTVVLPWRALGEAVRVVEVDALAGDDRLGALLAGIGPRTRVVAVSHVSSFTGTLVDIGTLGAACRRAGALLVVDGAQAAGVVTVGLDDVDFYIATGYKWLLGGFGLAVVAGKRAALASLRPSPLWGDRPPTPRLSIGHSNLPGMYALEAAATYRRSVGHEEIRARVADLARRLWEGAAELGHAPAARPERMAGIVSLGGLRDLPGAVARLSSAGLSVAARGGYLRMSPYFYTTDTDVDHLLTELKNL
ncbi:aminotransferase class V-fold PLP-dependent enzyme [Microbispora sp. NPDC046933]|uniref:aminotransferase class V-fold PLP-dependent enzyme n=1 Tax=Microbispora sp. NPDC046933 TaxID=3155618 RepID=UPI0033C242D1